MSDIIEEIYVNKDGRVIVRYRGGKTKDCTDMRGVKIYCATNGAADRISDLERRNGELEEALRDLMDWQIKNVAAPDNPAYNAAHEALTRTKEQK